MPSLKEGHQVRLIPFDPKYAATLFAWYYDVTYKAFFRDFDRPLSLEDFKKFDTLMNSIGYGFFLILDKQSNLPIGMLTHHCLKRKARVIRIGILLDNLYQHKTHCIEALILGGDYLYNDLGYEKLVIEFLASDTHIKRIAEKGGWIFEANLKKEAVLDGEYLDELRYYMFKETYQKLYGNYLSPRP